MDEQEYQNAIDFLSMNCPAFAEFEYRIGQEVANELTAVNLHASMLLNAESAEKADRHYSKILAINKMVADKIGRR